jgi:hypothetical protein
MDLWFPLPYLLRFNPLLAYDLSRNALLEVVWTCKIKTLAFNAQITMTFRNHCVGFVSKKIGEFRVRLGSHHKKTGDQLYILSRIFLGQGSQQSMF